MSPLLKLLQQKIQYVFNRISLNFIKEIKNKDPELKSQLKKNYMVFDKITDKHMNYYLEIIKTLEPQESFLKSHEDVDILELSYMKESEILKGIKVCDILKVVSDEEKYVVKCYLYMLYMLGYLFEETLQIEDYYKETDTENADDAEDNAEDNAEDDAEDDVEDAKNDEVDNSELVYRITELESMFTKSMKII